MDGMGFNVGLIGTSEILKDPFDEITTPITAFTAGFLNGVCLFVDGVGIIQNTETMLAGLAGG
ncbi:MAG: hypothetical protein AB1665_00685 [Candidatus Thermoplasmatota archaeon]